MPEKIKPLESSSEEFLYKLISTLAPNPKKIGDFVKQVKKENPKLNRAQLAEYMADYIGWQYTGQGAAVGLPGAIPGLGTVTQLAIAGGVLSVAMALMIRNQTYLVFALGHCYGIRGREPLIQGSLLCIGLWTKVLVLTKNGAIRLGTKVFNTTFQKKFSADILKAINCISPP